MLTRGEMPAGTLFVDLCANRLHEGCITGENFRDK